MSGEPTSAHYLGEAGRRYAAERFTDRQRFGRRWQARYFQPFCGPALTLLDFGCGDGTILRELPAARKLGVEVNPHCVARIREANAADPVPVEVMGALSDVPDSAADIVISNHSLEHTPEPMGVLREIRRVLRPGGRLVVVTPFDDWRALPAPRWVANDRQNHLYTWSPLNLGNLLVEAGYEVQRAELQSTAWSPKLFWIHRWCGAGAFALACQALARVKCSREVLAVATRPAAAGPAPTR